MRYGIPDYRLPDSVLDDFQYRHLELKGIKVRTNTTIGRTLTIDDLFRDGYKSVFIGAGLWKANAMHIKGESLGNVAFGIDYLANSKAFRLGDDIAVIGVGNSAMDCARTAIRNGARHVTCYARRDESCITASEYEVSYAKLEGVGFRFCKAPVEIREDGLVCGIPCGMRTAASARWRAVRCSTPTPVSSSRSARARRATWCRPPTALRPTPAAC